MNRLHSLLGLLFLTGCCATQALAQGYPEKPIQLIVPYSAGGGADVIARSIAKNLSTALKQPVVIDNKPGAAGQIAAAYVAHAAADGYTLLLCTDSIYSINPAMYGKPAVDALNHLMPITNLVGSPVVIVVSATGPIPSGSLADIVAYVRKSGKPLAYATPGIGTPHQLIAESIGRAAGIKMNHIPYKGTSSALADLIGGQYDVLFGMPSSVQQLVSAGKLKIVAVTSPDKFELLPNVPTVSQTYKGVSMATVDMGLAAPIGTPMAVIKLLNEQVRTVLARADVQTTMHENGMVPIGDSADDYGKRMKLARQERERLMTEAGVKPE